MKILLPNLAWPIFLILALYGFYFTVNSTLINYTMILFFTISYSFLKQKYLSVYSVAIMSLFFDSINNFYFGSSGLIIIFLYIFGSILNTIFNKVQSQFVLTIVYCITDIFVFITTMVLLYIISQFAHFTINYNAFTLFFKIIVMYFSAIFLLNIIINIKKP